MSQPEYTLRTARPADMEGVARVFAAAFPESVAHYFGKPPPDWVVAEPFQLCLASEPDGFFVAQAPDGTIAGYIFAPARTSRLWRVAITRGFALRWLWRWVSGRYGIGLGPVRSLARSKMGFRASSRAPGIQAEARILSIAVHPDHRGRGLATRLCRMGLERLDRLGASPVRLEVRPSNDAALTVYTRLGFEPAGVTEDSQGRWLIMLRRAPAKESG